MGSIILCHKYKGKDGFELVRIHRSIYTLEELCYYLCNHLYLVDYTVMNEKLCSWLEEELKLEELADTLRLQLRQHGSAEQFILTVLAHSSIYTTAELTRIQNTLEKLKNQKPVEKLKHKGDSLLEGGALRQAVSIYQSILGNEKDESMDNRFYGKVYACLGAAYGRLFLYKESANMYANALRVLEDEAVKKAYVYAVFRSSSPEEYRIFLQGNQEYMKLDFSLQQQIQETGGRLSFPLKEDTLKEWKEEYRKIGNGER